MRPDKYTNNQHKSNKPVEATGTPTKNQYKINPAVPKRKHK